MKETLSLCIVRRNGKILLGKKKRGYGKGKWNGFGGKIEAGEAPEQAAVRELREECGLESKVCKPCARLVFSEAGKTHDVHVFLVEAFYGDPAPSEEMDPVQWFAEDEIPFNNMWSDDKFWLPHVLSGKQIHGSFVLNKNNLVTYYEIFYEKAE